MKKLTTLILGLSLFSSGLYASEYTEDEAKKRSAALALQECDELLRLKQQTPEQTAQADRLHEAIGRNEVVKVRKLLQAKADVHARSSDNNNALRVAFTPEMIQLLFEHKADINGIDLNKRTALHWQCLMVASRLNTKSKDIAKQSIITLLKCNANVNAQEQFGQTPLNYLRPIQVFPCLAEDSVTLLLEYGANPNTANLLSRLHETLDSDDYFDKELRVPTCKMIIMLDNHRKQLDCIDGSLTQMSKDLVGIIQEYGCGKHRPDDKKLDALLKDFDWLFKQLRESGKLS